jgi:hypothetical protein
MYPVTNVKDNANRNIGRVISHKLIPMLFMASISFWDDIRPITISTPAIIPSGRAYEIADGISMHNNCKASRHVSRPIVIHSTTSRIAFATSNMLTNKPVAVQQMIKVSLKTYLLKRLTAKIIQRQS